MGKDITGDDVYGKIRVGAMKSPASFVCILIAAFYFLSFSHSYSQWISPLFSWMNTVDPVSVTYFCEYNFIWEMIV